MFACISKPKEMSKEKPKTQVTQTQFTSKNGISDNVLYNNVYVNPVVKRMLKDAPESRMIPFYAAQIEQEAVMVSKSSMGITQYRCMGLYDIQTSIGIFIKNMKTGLVAVVHLGTHAHVHGSMLRDIGTKLGDAAGAYYAMRIVGGINVWDSKPPKQDKDAKFSIERIRQLVVAINDYNCLQTFQAKIHIISSNWGCMNQSNTCIINPITFNLMSSNTPVMDTEVKLREAYMNNMRILYSPVRHSSLTKT